MSLLGPLALVVALSVSLGVIAARIATGTFLSPARVWRRRREDRDARRWARRMDRWIDQ